MFLLISMFISLQSPTAMAGESNYCTEWVRQSSTNCVFNNRSAPVWKRQCTHYYFSDTFCHPSDPNQLEGPCTEWIRSNQQCRSHRGRMERQWHRSCTMKYYETTFCSNLENPNHL